MYALDLNEHLFHSYMPENKKKKLRSLCFIVACEHMYICTESSFLNKVNSYTRNDVINNQVIKQECPKEIYYNVDDPSVIIKDTDSLFETLVEYVDKGVIPNSKDILCIPDFKCVLQFEQTLEIEYHNLEGYKMGHPLKKKYYLILQ